MKQIESTVLSTTFETIFNRSPIFSTKFPKTRTCVNDNNNNNNNNNPISVQTPRYVQSHVDQKESWRDKNEREFIGGKYPAIISPVDIEIHDYREQNDIK